MLASIRSLIATAALGLLIVYFGVHALTGERDILTTRERDAALTAKLHELNAAKAQHQDLEIRAKLMRDQSLSADLLEDRTRTLLGFANSRD